MKIKIERSFLRIIAFVCMFLDHVAFTLMGPSILADSFRIVGRLAFPIFCYFLVQGFLHTSSRRCYAFRLFVLALVSQIPYMFCFLSIELNVVFELLAGLLMLNFVTRPSIRPVDFLGLLASLLLSSLADYGMMGLVVILTMYLVYSPVVDGKQVLVVKSRFFSVLLVIFLFLISLEFCGAAVLALPLIDRCSDDQGLKLPRILTYGFYPLHLVFLWFLQVALPLV